MKSIVPSNVITGVLIVISFSISSILMSACTASSGSSARVSAASLTEEEKHRLYAAAMAASEFPLESRTFTEVCKKIGIFDATGNQNDRYTGFVTAHLDWAMKTQTQQFKREINSREKACEYLNKFQISEINAPHSSNRP